MKIAVVLGCGVNLDEPYKEYLSAIAESGEQFEYMIFSGGATSRYYNYLTEAGVMVGYFTRKYSKAVGFPRIIREDASKTSKQKLSFSRSIIEKLAETHSPEPLEIVIFHKNPLGFLTNLMVMHVFTSTPPNWRVYIQ